MRRRVRRWAMRWHESLGHHWCQYDYVNMRHGATNVRMCDCGRSWSWRGEL